jgi:hypothetical protein
MNSTAGFQTGAFMPLPYFSEQICKMVTCPPGIAAIITLEYSPPISSELD